MPRSQISEAKVTTDAQGLPIIKVVGPLQHGSAAPEGAAEPVEDPIALLTMYVVLAKAGAHAAGPLVPGTGRIDDGSSWTVHAVPDGVFAKDDVVVATGLAVFADRGEAGDVPIPQIFSWSENVKLA